MTEWRSLTKLWNKIIKKNYKSINKWIKDKNSMIYSEIKTQWIIYTLELSGKLYLLFKFNFSQRLL